ncbi:hypothetical protein [Stratiformator vulcanicus]|uniref:Uncharacterized protein n=1 Tax=Stratiformator vulcanicus TaxID=2527980 RepID=A0A517R078_9PLAN|nr:hypothetical protein [Stratiformator vulcanicus]QDT37224.1 hypothetical protein Pan189_15970 [Stratiformator vulcanicus]
MTRMAGILGMVSAVLTLGAATGANAQCCGSAYPTFVRPTTTTLFGPTVYGGGYGYGGGFGSTSYYGPSLFDVGSYFGTTTSYYGPTLFGASPYYGTTASYYGPTTSYAGYGSTSYYPSTSFYPAAVSSCCPGSCGCNACCNGCASGNCPNGNCGVNYGPDDLKPEPEPEPQSLPPRDPPPNRTFDSETRPNPLDDDLGRPREDGFDRFDRGADDGLDTFDAFKPIPQKERAPDPDSLDPRIDTPEIDLNDPVDELPAELDIENANIWEQPLRRGPELGPSAFLIRREQASRFRAPRLAAVRPWQDGFGADSDITLIGYAEAK